MGCFYGSPKSEQKEPIGLDNRNSQANYNVMKTTRNNLAKYYLKFPRINKAYKHLFTGWSDAIGKSVNEKADAGEIFNLEGPSDKVSEALSKAGILATTLEVLDVLKNEVISPRDNTETLRFKDIIIAVGSLIKSGKVKQYNNDEKFDDVKNGFMIIKEMFAQIDADGSGEISLDEFTEAFADLSHGDESGIKQKRMAELDFNNDQEISYPEFCVGLSVWVGFIDEFE